MREKGTDLEARNRARFPGSLSLCVKTVFQRLLMRNGQVLCRRLVRDLHLFPGAAHLFQVPRSAPLPR